MKIQVLLFAQMRDVFKTDQLEIEVAESATVGDVVESLMADRSAIPGLPIRFAVNEAFVQESHRVSEGDRLALIPPVSGG